MTLKRRLRAPKPSRLPPLRDVISDDGARFTLRGLQARPSAPVILVLPAMGATAKFYVPIARALNRSGLNVATTDLRGHGESVPAVSRTSRFGYREMVEDDLAAVLAAVRQEFPQAHLVILGHSLGGQLALLHLARGDPWVRGIILVASGSAWYGGFGGWRGLRNLTCSQLFALSAAVIGYWPGHLAGFGGRQSRGVMRDWARQVRTGRYTLAPGTVDYEAAMRTITLPVLVIDVANDDLAPPGAVTHLCSKIPGAQISRWMYSQAIAGGKNLDHFRWVRHHHGLLPRLTVWIGELDSSVKGP